MGVNQWDFNHSQSWLVYDIDIPTLMLQKNQMRHISKFWMILYLDSLRPMKLVQRVLCGWLGPLSKYVPCWPVLLVSKAQHPCWLIVMSGENSWVRHRVKPGLINPDWSTGVTRVTPKKRHFPGHSWRTAGGHQEELCGPAGHGNWASGGVESLS